MHAARGGGAWGAKITGAGGGCIVALAEGGRRMLLLLRLRTREGMQSSLRQVGRELRHGEQNAGYRGQSE